jgi:hypothetical protein
MGRKQVLRIKLTVYGVLVAIHAAMTVFLFS